MATISGGAGGWQLEGGAWTSAGKEHVAGVSSGSRAKNQLRGMNSLSFSCFLRCEMGTKVMSTLKDGCVEKMSSSRL